MDGKGCWVKATSPPQSEIFTTREACSIIRLCRIYHAIIESDCKMTIQLLSEDITPPRDCAVLAKDIKSMIAPLNI